VCWVLCCVVVIACDYGYGLAVVVGERVIEASLVKDRRRTVSGSVNRAFNSSVTLGIQRLFVIVVVCICVNEWIEYMHYIYRYIYIYLCIYNNKEYSTAPTTVPQFFTAIAALQTPPCPSLSLCNPLMLLQFNNPLTLSLSLWFFCRVYELFF